MTAFPPPAPSTAPAPGAAPAEVAPVTLTPGLQRLLALMAGVTAANMYLIQPLLADLARQFGVTESQVGLLPTLCQLGYGVGILLLLPLCDILERRTLILVLLGCVTLALLGAALAPTVSLLGAACLLIGFTTIVPQVVVPYAAALARPEQRTGVIGKVQSGLIVGILLARTVSGWVADLLSWRWVYALSAALMLALAWRVYRRLPRNATLQRLPYGHLLRSMARMMVREPALKNAIRSSTLLFAAFSVFWTALPFLISSPRYGYGPGVTGSFGIVGVVGALLAPQAGKFADRYGRHLTIGLATLLCVLAFGVFALGGHGLAWVALGVVLMDLGVQSNHITNQAEIFSVNPNARGRSNGAYMFLRFTGGAGGSLLGAWAYSTGGWGSVCAIGASLCVLALAFFATSDPGRRLLGSLRGLA